MYEIGILVSCKLRLIQIQIIIQNQLNGLKTLDVICPKKREKGIIDFCYKV